MKSGLYLITISLRMVSMSWSLIADLVNLQFTELYSNVWQQPVLAVKQEPYNHTLLAKLFHPLACSNGLCITSGSQFLHCIVSCMISIRKYQRLLPIKDQFNCTTCTCKSDDGLNFLWTCPLNECCAVSRVLCLSSLGMVCS